MSVKRIAIHGVPRSGTTWLGEIFNSSRNTRYCYQPLFSYAFKGYLTPHSSKEDVSSFFDRLLDTDDDFICQAENRARGILPRFEKNRGVSHVIYKEVRYLNILPRLMQVDEEVRLVCLIRNPLAVLASWFEAPREFDPQWDRGEEWFYAERKNCGRPEEFYGFDRWMEATRIFLSLKRAYPDRVCVIRYSDLLSKPEETVRNLFAFAELDVDDQVEAFLESSRNTDVNDAYSVFRTNASDEKWKNVLSPDIVESVRRHMDGNELAEYLQ